MCTGKTGAGIETHTVATGTAVDFDLTRVRLEVLRRVLGSDTTLNSEATFGDSLLSQAKLGERSTSRNLDLSGNNIDASDFL